MISHGFDILYMIGKAGLVVQAVLLILILLSVGTWAIIFIKYRYIRKALTESAVFLDYFWKTRDLSHAFSRAKQLPFSPVARVFRIGYLELQKMGRYQNTDPHGRDDQPALFNGTGNIQRALRRAINSEMTRLTQMVPFLATTGNTAPFIGLFGTVWGIMNSFAGIGQKGSASLAVVAPGISEALVATATGLAAAIPAVMGFNYFTNKISVIESDLEGFTADFINIIERDLVRVKERGQ